MKDPPQLTSKSLCTVITKGGGFNWSIKRNTLNRRTERKEGLEIVREIEARIERDSADTNLIHRKELLTLIPLQRLHLFVKL